MSVNICGYLQLEFELGMFFECAYLPGRSHRRLIRSELIKAVY